MNGTLYFGDAPEVAWKDLTHVDYSDTANPKPPHYQIYTGLKSSQFFTCFVFFWTVQIFCIWLHNFLTSNLFKKWSWFDQLMMSFQSVITPAPSEDWAVGPGTITDHVQRLKTVKREVIGTIKINSIFHLLNVLPLVYLGKPDYKLSLLRVQKVPYLCHCNLQIVFFLFSFIQFSGLKSSVCI